MGKLTVFGVSLSNPDGVYYAGQMLQGLLSLELSEPMKMKGIRVTFRGKAFVHWTEQQMRGPGETRYKEVRHYSSTEDYFDYNVTLFGKALGEKGEKSVLPPGRYSYPFQFQLPPNLPSSFEGMHGYVRYFIKGTIDKPWKFDHTTKTPFTVICALDLNRVPSANSPVQEAKQKKLCCLCCLTGPVTALLCCERRGYVPGEPIAVNAEIVNLTNRKMGASSVELKMMTTFHSAMKTRSVTRQICKLKHGSIGKGERDVWNGEQLFVPSLPPSYLLGCSIIDIKYFLELRVDPVGPAFDLSLPVEVIIGTIPLQSAIQQYLTSHPVQAAISHAALHSSRSSSGPSSNSSGSLHLYNLLATSHNESVFGKVYVRDEDDDEYTRGDLHYAPLYTYYHWVNGTDTRGQ